MMDDKEKPIYPEKERNPLLLSRRWLEMLEKKCIVLNIIPLVTINTINYYVK